jgi:uncharacterized protein YigA (DUF484 family)
VRVMTRPLRLHRTSPMATSRTNRDLQRGRHAAARARAAGGSALAAAFAHIEATFSAAMHHSAFKDRVATLIRSGAANPEVWTRYRRLVERYPTTNLDAAIVLVERMRGAELEARAASIRNWGHSSRPRLSLMILDEVRLILRMLRRYEPARFSGLMAAVQAADLATPEWPGVTIEAAE